MLRMPRERDRRVRRPGLRSRQKSHAALVIDDVESDIASGHCVNHVRKPSAHVPNLASQGETRTDMRGDHPMDFFNETMGRRPMRTMVLGLIVLMLGGFS